MLQDGSGVAIMAIKNNKQHNVLIVEDNSINMDLLIALLEPFDFSIITSKDGYDALKKIADSSDLSLILLDIGLPGIDGIEVFKKIKCMDKHKNVPVIAVTAHAMAGNREHLLSLGFDDFVEKPINKNMLYEKIRKHIGFE